MNIALAPLQFYRSVLQKFAMRTLVAKAYLEVEYPVEYLQYIGKSSFINYESSIALNNFRSISIFGSFANVLVSI